MFKYFKRFLPKPIYKKNSFSLTNLFPFSTWTIPVVSLKYADSITSVIHVRKLKCTLK